MKQILSSQNLSYLLKQAIQCYEKADFDKSISLLAKVLKGDSKNFDALHLTGIILSRQKKFDLAVKYYDKALKINPMNFEVYSNKASSLRELKQYDESLFCYDRSIELNPNNQVAFRNKANLLREIKRNDEADICEKQANNLNAVEPADFYKKGNMHLKNKQYEKAIFCFNQALNKDPHHVDTIVNRGVAYENLNNFEGALSDYEKALKIKPNFFQVLSNKAAVLKKMGYLNDAMLTIEQSIKVENSYAPAYCNQAVIFEELGMLKDAVNSSNQAIRIDPKNEIAYSNKASALKNLNCFDEALENCEKAIQLNPNFYTPVYNRALINLHLKKYKQGWIDYESRINLARSFYLISTKELPVWNGLTCNSLLIYCEEGIGDEIFYVRVLKNINNDIKKITALVDKRSIPIMSRSFPKILFLPRDSKVDKNLYDAQILIGSIPKLLEINPIIHKEEPYLKNNTDLTNKIRINNQFNQSFVCGLSWRSSEKNGQKNIKLRDLEKIITLANCQFVNLQYGDIKTELSQLDKNSQEKLKLIDSIDLFNDIEGLFSLVAACDLVITTSNVTAHVAGAIGKECILLAPYSQGRIWYWHQEQISSWYPTIRIFSQDSSLSWAGALDSALSVLKNKTSN